MDEAKVLVDAWHTEHQMIGVFPTQDDPDSPTFTYTLDLSKVKPGWPELLVIGLLEQGGSLINALAGQAEPPLGLVRFERAPFAFMVRLVDPEVARAEWCRMASDGAAIAQIVVPDEQGRFPWEPGCSEPYASVPMLPVAT